MSSCSDDAALVGPVAMFLGVEVASWSIQQFIDAATFCKQHNITTIFVKVFEVGSTAGNAQGLWFDSIGGYDKVVQAIDSVGIKCIVYGFLYGDTYGNLITEIATSTQLLKQCGTLCLDMEGSYWSNTNSANWATQIAQALTPIPGKLWLSCPADPAQNNQLAFVQALSPAVNIYMPMVYSDSLESLWPQSFNIANECIQPTLDLSQEFGSNNILSIASAMKQAGVLVVSLWEYQFAVANPQLVDSIVNVFSSSQGSSSVQLNKQGMVLDIQQSYQLENGESQDLCGPWSVSALRLAGLPGQGPRGTAEDIDTWADSEANKYMPNGQVGWPGTSIQQMYQFLTDALDPTGKQRNLHWWDINPTVANIQAAVKAGYPVLVTANEQNIRDKRTGSQPPYPWHLNANHILPICGLDAQGDFICPDELNNNFQGYWPPVYVASVLQPSWATIVQVVGPDLTKPWLAPIPSGDPSTWPANFNAQQFTAGGSTTQTNNFSQEASDCWNSVFQNTLKETPPPQGTGIFKSWCTAWQENKQYGPPITFEYPSVNASGGKIIAQEFAHARCEWDGSAHWYSVGGNA